TRRPVRSSAGAWRAPGTRPRQGNGQQSPCRASWHTVSPVCTGRFTGIRGRWRGARLVDPVGLEDPAADDHALDVGGAFADQEHGGLAVEAFDLGLGGVAVAAVDAEGVLDDVAAVFGGEVLGHAGLEVAAFAGVLGAGGVDQHLVGGLDLDGHVGEAELDGLVVGDGLAERAALLGVADGEFEGAQGDAAAAGGDVDAADLDAVHHLVEAAAGGAAEDLAGGGAVAAEDHLGGVDALVAHFVDLAGDGEAGLDLAEALGLLHQEGGHVAVDRVGALVGLDQDGDQG